MGNNSSLQFCFHVCGGRLHTAWTFSTHNHKPPHSWWACVAYRNQSRKQELYVKVFWLPGHFSLQSPFCWQLCKSCYLRAHGVTLSCNLGQDYAFYGHCWKARTQGWKWHICGNQVPNSGHGWNSAECHSLPTQNGYILFLYCLVCFPCYTRIPETRWFIKKCSFLLMVWRLWYQHLHILWW